MGRRGEPCRLEQHWAEHRVAEVVAARAHEVHAVLEQPHRRAVQLAVRAHVGCDVLARDFDERRRSTTTIPAPSRSSLRSSSKAVPHAERDPSVVAGAREAFPAASCRGLAPESIGDHLGRRRGPCTAHLALVAEGQSSVRRPFARDSGVAAALALVEEQPVFCPPTRSTRMNRATVVSTRSGTVPHHTSRRRGSPSSPRAAPSRRCTRHLRREHFPREPRHTSTQARRCRASILHGEAVAVATTTRPGNWSDCRDTRRRFSSPGSTSRAAASRVRAASRRTRGRSSRPRA